MTTSLVCALVFQDIRDNDTRPRLTQTWHCVRPRSLCKISHNGSENRQQKDKRRLRASVASGGYIIALRLLCLNRWALLLRVTDEARCQSARQLELGEIMFILYSTPFCRKRALECTTHARERAFDPRCYDPHWLQSQKLGSATPHVTGTAPLF